jgi:CheY-like chemotaxis protein
MDYNMPGMKVTETVQAMKSTGIPARVIICTANAHHLAQYLASVIGILPKPYYAA